MFSSKHSVDRSGRCPLGDGRFPRRGRRGGRHVARRGCDTRQLCNATALQIERPSVIFLFGADQPKSQCGPEVISDARGLSNRHLAKLPDGGLVELNPPGQVRDLGPAFAAGAAIQRPLCKIDILQILEMLFERFLDMRTPACAPCERPRRVGDRKPDRKG